MNSIQMRPLPIIVALIVMPFLVLATCVACRVIPVVVRTVVLEVIRAVTT